MTFEYSSHHVIHEEREREVRSRQHYTEMAWDLKDTEDINGNSITGRQSNVSRSSISNITRSCNFIVVGVNRIVIVRKEDEENEETARPRSRCNIQVPQRVNERSVYLRVLKDKHVVHATCPYWHCSVDRFRNRLADPDKAALFACNIARTDSLHDASVWGHMAMSKIWYIWIYIHTSTPPTNHKTISAIYALDYIRTTHRESVSLCSNPWGIVTHALFRQFITATVRSLRPAYNIFISGRRTICMRSQYVYIYIYIYIYTYIYATATTMSQ